MGVEPPVRIRGGAIQLCVEYSSYFCDGSGFVQALDFMQRVRNVPSHIGQEDSPCNQLAVTPGIDVKAAM